MRRSPDRSYETAPSHVAVAARPTVRMSGWGSPNADFRAATSAPWCLDWVLLLPGVLPGLRSFFEGRYRRWTWPGRRSLPMGGPGGHERNDRFESAQMTASRHGKGLIGHCLQKTVLQPISGMTAASAPRPSWAVLAEVRARLEIARSEGQRTGAETRVSAPSPATSTEPARDS